MNLYEHEGKEIFARHGIQIPRGVLISREMNSAEAITQAYTSLAIPRVVVKAQILSGKRGKNNGIYFCSTEQEVVTAVDTLFQATIHGQYVASVLVEEMLDIAEEHYLSIVYDTASKQPMLLASSKGGMDIEDVGTDSIHTTALDIRVPELSAVTIPYAQELWNCFREVDARVVEINPLVKTKSGEWFAADAKIALDDDAFFRHESWSTFASRTMMGRLPTEREEAVKKIDEGEAYYRGTAGKYIEMDGDIAILFSGGGASIANMDALMQEGLKPANYTEYSGNPPREKVAALAKVVLSKPGLKGLWIAGGVANFTNIAETFQGIVDALDEVKPTYPIVVRRAGPYEQEGMDLMRACALRNQLDMTLFGKETSMSESAHVLATRILG
jgi:succinyl-CoA synthetase beta subunit